MPKPTTFEEFDQAALAAASAKAPAASPSPAPELTFAQKLVRHGALPTIGSVLGGVAGGAIAAPTIAGVPAGVVAGEMAGGAAGEGLNQLLGITEPSAGQIGLAAAGGPVGRAVGGLVRRGAAEFGKLLPGASVPLQAEAVATARTIAGRYGPAQRSEILFDQLDKLNPRVKMDATRQAVIDLLEKEVAIPEGLKSEKLIPSLRGLLDEINSYGGDVPFATFRGSMTRVGQRTGSVEGLEANELRGAFKYLTAALEKDLEFAAKQGGKAGLAGRLLQEANKTYRQEKGVERLTEYIESSVNKGRGDLLESFNPSRAINKIKEDEYLRESFDPGVMDEVVAALKRLKGMPSLPPPSGDAPIGSGRVNLRLAVGGAAGSLLGNPWAGAAIAGGGSAVIAKALQTDVGRRALVRLVDPKTGFLDHRGMAALAQLVSGVRAVPGRGGIEDAGPIKVNIPKEDTQ